jgi:hypothetical protein
MAGLEFEPAFDLRDVFTFGADLRGWLAVDWLPTG